MTIAPSKKPFISGLVEGSLDVKVYRDILKTYAKETITLLDFGNTAMTNVDPQTISRVEFTECEISPFRKNELDCEATSSPLFARQSSIHSFAEKKVNFADIQHFLIDSFSPTDAGNRPYPSAGGLYPIEPLIFLFKERINDQENLLSGCYHFRSVSKKLQLIKKIPMHYFFDKMLHGFIDNHSLPCFCLLYMAHIGKTLFKYRYRGYRHALMEVGSMYQQAMFTSQQLGLRSTVWSTFSDHEMLYELDLDYGTYMPLTMQLFGYGEPHALS